MDTIIPNRKCTTCGKEFPATTENFYRKSCGKYGLSSKCKSCDYSRKIDWNKKNPEKYRALTRLGHYRLKERNPNYQSEYVKKRRYEAKKIVFDAYGGKCFCCGEDRFEFLSIDHINGDGHNHRNEMNKKSSFLVINIYRDIAKKGFPKEYRVLCFNCHMANDFYGYCPHGNIKREYDRKK